MFERLRENIQQYGLILVIVFLADSIYRLIFSSYMLDEGVFCCLFILLWIPYAGYNRQKYQLLFRNRLTWLLVWILLAQVVSIAVNRQEFSAYYTSLFRQAIWLFALYPFGVFHRDDFSVWKTIVKSYAVMLMLPIYASFIIFVSNSVFHYEIPFISLDTVYKLDRRYGGVFRNQTSLGLLSCLLIYTSFLCIRYTAKGQKKWVRILLYCNMAVGISTVFMSYARSAAIILGFSVVCMIAMHHKRSKIKLHKGIIIAVIAVIIVAEIYITLGSGRFTFELSNLLHWDVLNLLTSDRLSLWESTVRMTVHYSPYFGLGTGTFRAVAKSFLDPTDYIVKDQLPGPHNMFVEVFFSTGIFGLIPVVILFWFFVQDAFRKMRNPGDADTFILACTVIAIFFTTMFDMSGVLYSGSYLSPFFWILIGMTYHKAHVAIPVSD